MQKKNSILILLSFAVFSTTAKAQETVYPAVAQKGATIITHATIHVGNGTVLNDASVLFLNGKIKEVGNNVTPPADATVVDATGKQVYPGLILPLSSLGLKEINSGVRGSDDYQEIGENNASIRSIVSYNTDSKVTNVLRSNGVLLAHVAPMGELIEGSSSVVQLDAWNYEDAAYKSDIGMFINMPSLMARRGRGGFMRPQAGDPSKVAFEKIEVLKKFFTDARAYLDEKNHASNNLKFEAVRGLYNGKQKLFIRAN
jgi:hypothetical protein